MKFLVITDLHENASAVEWINRLADENNVRAILFLGDVTDLGTCEDGRKILTQFKKETYFIPGNCDPRDISEKNSDIIKDVHGKAFEIDGIKFAAMGGSNPTIFDTPCEYPEEVLKSKLASISSKGMILMTHAPSYGILDHIPNGMSVGSKAIREIVSEFKPIVALSGHIHEDVGMQTVEGTLFINPGPARDGHAVLLETDGKTASAKAIGPSD